jgi:hypothetical protein
MTLFIVAASGSAPLVSAQGIVAPESVFGPFVEQTTLTPTGATAIDGDTALIATTGVVHVFDRTPGADVWTEVTQLIASDGGAGFGRAVAFDGTTAIVGADGAAYVFRRARRGAPAWREVARLVPADSNPNFGASVDVDADHVIVGAPAGPVTTPGAAYIFRREAPGPHGWLEVATLVAPVGPGLTRFGGDVNISADTAAVAELTGNVQGIAANIFGRHQGGQDSWGLARRIPETGFFLTLGGSVELSGDTLMIGTGEFLYSVGIYERNQGGLNAWGLLTRYGTPEQLCCGTVGRIEISGDRAILAIIGQGSQVHILARNQGGPNAWGRVSRLLPLQAFPPNPRYNSVSIDGDTAVVAASGINADNNAVVVLVSDLDGDTSRDAIDPCQKDPLNNVEGECQRSSWANPALDASITQTGFSSSSPLPRRTILTATYVNSSETPIRNPFFEVTSIGSHSVLVNSDEGRNGLGATLSPDVGDGVLSPGETMQVEFVVRHPIDAAVELAATFRGEPAP